MAKTFECRQAGIVCRAKVSGESDEEVLNKAVAHVRKAHGIDLSQAKTLTRYARSLVRDGSGGAEARE